MRNSVVTCAFALCCMLFLATAPSRSVAQAMDAKGIKSAVEQYTDAKTTDARRESLLGVLGKSNQPEVAKQIKTVAKKADRKEHALKLALQLELRGVFDSFEKDIATWPREVSQLAMLSADRKAEAAIVKKWKELAIDSDEWIAINHALSSLGADWATLEDLSKYAAAEGTPEDKAAAAGEILKWQLSLDTSDPLEISLLWSSIAESKKDFARHSTATGMDLSKHPSVESSHFERAGASLVYPKGGHANLTAGPTGMASPGYAVTFRLWFSEAPKSGGVGLMHSKGSDKPVVYGVQIKDGNWVLQKAGQEAKQAKVKTRAWTTVQMRASSYKGAAGASDGISFDFYVDGKLLDEDVRWAESAMSGFQANFPEIAWCLGGVDFLRD